MAQRDGHRPGAGWSSADPSGWIRRWASRRPGAIAPARAITRGRAGRCRALHQELRCLTEAEAAIEGLCVRRVQQPTQIAVGALLDRSPHQRRTEPSALVLRQDVHVGEVGEGESVGHDAGETHLAPFVVDTEHPVRLADETLDHLERAAEGPVRLVREEPVHGADVDSTGSSSISKPSARTRSGALVGC